MQSGKTYNMPDYFTHYITAEKIYSSLAAHEKREIKDYTLYLMGAQGGDIFFAYNLSPTKSNFGRRLHAMTPLELFEKLSIGNISYCAGFATHYALDCALHPAIYAFENTAKAPFAHLSFECDLGLYVSRKYSSPRKILPRQELLKRTFDVYDSIKNIEASVTVTGVERCLKRHFAYTKFVYRNKKQTYKFDYDYSTLSGATQDGIDLGISCVRSVLSHNIDSALFEKSFLEK
jgi:hypothetical protein